MLLIKPRPIRKIAIKNQLNITKPNSRMAATF